jgi:hypothetical protein
MASDHGVDFSIVSDFQVATVEWCVTCRHVLDPFLF